MNYLSKMVKDFEEELGVEDRITDKTKKQKINKWKEYQKGSDYAYSDYSYGSDKNKKSAKPDDGTEAAESEQLNKTMDEKNP